MTSKYLPILEVAQKVNCTSTVFSKIPLHILPTKKRDVPSPLQLEYNKCDNPHCTYKNPLQSVKGVYNCARPCLSHDIDASPISRSGSNSSTDSAQSLVILKNIKLAAPNGRFRTGGRNLKNDPFRPCKGTYVVTAEQAEVVSRQFYVNKTIEEKQKRRVMAEKKAAFKAHYRALQLAQEISMKQYMEKEQMEQSQDARQGCVEAGTSEGRWGLAIDKPARDANRPSTSGSSATNRIKGVQPSPLLRSSTDPHSRVRHQSESGNHPRPTGIMWHPSVTSPTEPLSGQRAQYPPCPSRNRDRSNSDGNVHARGAAGNARRSYRNGVVITHFGTLMPMTRTNPNAGGNKENASSGGGYFINRKVGGNGSQARIHGVSRSNR
ncbi:hypothetical protein AX17_006389 [Amanita inopinata Kibby_2008]|nr:hypothetical protein AX17_006389 [Amanita inopinata Kibby_2008]